MNFRFNVLPDVYTVLKNLLLYCIPFKTDYSIKNIYVQTFKIIRRFGKA